MKILFGLIFAGMITFGGASTTLNSSPEASDEGEPRASLEVPAGDLTSPIESYNMVTEDEAIGLFEATTTGAAELAIPVSTVADSCESWELYNIEVCPSGYLGLYWRRECFGSGGFYYQYWGGC